MPFAFLPTRSELSCKVQSCAKPAAFLQYLQVHVIRTVVYIQLGYHWCVLQLRGIVKAFASTCASLFFFLLMYCLKEPSLCRRAYESSNKKRRLLAPRSSPRPGPRLPCCSIFLSSFIHSFTPSFIHSFIHSIYSYRIVEKANKIMLIYTTFLLGL